MDNENLSKIISHALRHKPEEYNLRLSKNGWVSINKLIEGVRNKVPGFADLEVGDVVNMISRATKKRHEIKNDQIRALHGHSIKMDDSYQPVIPPTKLYHATAFKNWKSIKREGLDKMGRNYVHLATDPQAAIVVAKMKYKNIITLEIEAMRASEYGIPFYSNDKLTWLCKHVPPEYLSEVVE